MNINRENGFRIRIITPYYSYLFLTPSPPIGMGSSFLGGGRSGKRKGYVITFYKDKNGKKVCKVKKVK
jgi:hypothetical protein